MRYLIHDKIRIWPFKSVISSAKIQYFYFQIDQPDFFNGIYAIQSSITNGHSSIKK